MFIHSVSSTGSQLCHTQKPAFRTLPASSSTLFDYFSKMFTCWGGGIQMSYLCLCIQQSFLLRTLTRHESLHSLQTAVQSSFPTRADSSTHLQVQAVIRRQVCQAYHVHLASNSSGDDLLNHILLTKFTGSDMNFSPVDQSRHHINQKATGYPICFMMLIFNTWHVLTNLLFYCSICCIND